MISLYWKRVKRGIFSSSIYFYCLYVVIGILVFGIRKGLIFGTLLVVMGWLPVLLIYSSADYWVLQRSFKKYGRIDYTLNQMHVIKVSCNVNEAINYALKAIREFKGMQNITINRQGGIIEGERRRNWKTQGEHIKILAKEESGVTFVEVCSWPVKKRQFWDFAQNYQNVEILCERIRKLIM